ncbi:uncharacterized protein LOC127798322 [Diospyros lotus]|uniref:uncharacterized protein LOC127798322 n=1 Tax=Diospyros lotus TaxID=55363 RepID=UPI002252A627|nr:uncharacterized protein LOC127798322 [Diospyros lotus]
MLEEEAGKWWQTAKRALQRSHSRQGSETEETPVSVWEAFKKAFNDKYFPLTWRQEKSWEFANLKQTGEMTVAQYDTKFNQLIKYVPIKQGHISRDCRKRKETPPVKDLSKIVCFQCNQPGHYSSNCPKRPRLGQVDGPTEKIGEARGTRQVCVYNLTKEDVGTDPTVMQGTLFISDTLVHALIDPGSTHSFMSYALATSLEVEARPMESLIIISTPMGKSTRSSKVIEEC